MGELLPRLTHLGVVEGAIPPVYAVVEAERGGIRLGEDRFEITVADLTRDDSLRGMAGRVLAAAPERFALAGLSMGGYVAQEILREAPDRVTRVALLDTSARRHRNAAPTTAKNTMTPMMATKRYVSQK